jgi:hypothetical protein
MQTVSSESADIVALVKVFIPVPSPGKAKTPKAKFPSLAPLNSQTP